MWQGLHKISCTPRHSSESRRTYARARIKRKHPRRGGCFLLIDHVQSNWNLICSELVRWLKLHRGEPVLSYSTAAD